MINKYINYKEQLLNETYSEDRKVFDKVVSLWVFYITRPISFIITPIFLLFGFSANAITLLGFLVGIFSFILCINGQLFNAALLYNIFLIFDSIDGNIARLNGPSKNGEYYDAVTGDIINFLFIPFIGYGVYHNYVGFILKNILIIDNIFIISLIVSLLQLMFVLNSQRKKIIFNKKSGPVRIGGNKKIYFTEYIVRNSFGFAFNAPMSLLLSFYNALDILILYNLVIMPFILIFSIFKK